jgi:tetratricopeptide (TPR) repeat protein
LAVLLLACLAIPVNLRAEDAAEYARRAMEWNQKGEYDKAIADCDEALRLFDPKDGDKFVVYLIRGIAWNMKGAYDKSLADYDEALAIHPQEANIYSGRGWVWYRKGDYDKALADYNEAIRLKPNDGNFYKNLASLYATCPDKKYRDGRKAVDNATKACQLTGEKDPGCLETLAAAYAESGDLEKATQWEAKALELCKTAKLQGEEPSEPEDTQELVNRGNAWFDKGEYDKAIADYSRVISLGPGPNYALAYYNRGNAWCQKREYDKALEDSNQAITVDPNYAPAYYLRGNLWSGKDDSDKAIADYSQAIALDPNYASAYYVRGNLWFGKGEYGKAIADDNRALQLEPNNADAYYARGVAWYRKGEYIKAIADCSRVLRLDPNHANAYYIRGVAWNDKGLYDKAIAQFNEALRLDPHHASAYGSRGRAWNSKGEFDKAIADCNEALRLNSTLPDAFAYYVRGWAWAHKGEQDKAIADYDQVLAINPKYADAYCSRAAAWNAKGEYDKAFADGNQAFAVAPNDAGACNCLAWFQATCPDEKYRDGKKAVKNASRACQLSGEKDWSFLDTLAAAYAESGDFEKAEETEAKAIGLAETGKSVTDKDKAAVRSRLELYKQGQPYREPSQKAGDTVKKTLEPEKPAAKEAAAWRTWTDSTGKFTVEARLAGVTAGEARLIKRDGSTIQIPLQKLSDDDQEWVNRRIGKGGTDKGDKSDIDGAGGKE